MRPRGLLGWRTARVARCAPAARSRRRRRHAWRGCGDGAGGGRGPDRIAAARSLPHATVHRAIRRLGLSRPKVARPPAVRYERAGAGELLHVDTKKLGGLTHGVGHRAHGDRSRRVHRPAGWRVLYAAVDDATRVAYAELLADERGATAAAFLRRATAHFAARGVAVERVLTDNGSPFVSRAWRAACAELGTAPRRTRPYRPQTNGKVERWFQTTLRECLYAQILGSEPERAVALRRFVRYYNAERPHLALRGLTPLQRLAELSTTS